MNRNYLSAPIAVGFHALSLLPSGGKHAADLSGGNDLDAGTKRIAVRAGVHHISTGTAQIGKRLPEPTLQGRGEREFDLNRGEGLATGLAYQQIDFGTTRTAIKKELRPRRRPANDLLDDKTLP